MSNLELETPRIQTKRSVFCLLQRVDTGHILVVLDKHGSINLPGGKSETCDSSQFTTLVREFKEEVNRELPYENYCFFEWGCEVHTIRIYFKRLSVRQADKLCENGHPRRNENHAETVQIIKWIRPVACDDMKHHVEHAIRIWEQVAKQTLLG